MTSIGSEAKFMNMLPLLIALILYVPVNIFFQLCQDVSSWVEPVLSLDYCVLLKDTIQ